MDFNLGVRIPLFVNLGVRIPPYALDTPEQREALQQEILDRITAIQKLCGTLSMAQLDDADPRSHFGMVEAVALLSRDMHGMLDAYFDNGP